MRTRVGSIARLVLVAVGLALTTGIVVAACTPAGAENGPCYGNGTCDASLTCASNVCVHVDGSEGEGAASAEGEGAAAAEGEGGAGEGEGGGAGEGEGGGAGEGEGGAGEGEGEGTAPGCINASDVILNENAEPVCGQEHACNQTTQCDAGYGCGGTTCFCDDINSCGIRCGSDGSCPAHDVCDPRTQLCFFDGRSCLTDRGCAAGEACRNTPCPDCRTCVARGQAANGDACNDDTDCASAVCAGDECLEECGANADCPSGLLCNGARLEANVCVLSVDDSCTQTSQPSCTDGASVDQLCLDGSCRPHGCSVESDCAGGNCVDSIDGAFCRAETPACAAGEIEYAERLAGGNNEPQLCVREDRPCFTSDDCADLSLECYTGFDPFFGSPGLGNGATGYCALAL